jgi:putative FmdB family regulatory protein
MITFDYKCKCGHNEIDKRVKKSDEKVICPKCGETMTKMFSPPNLGGMDRFGRSK